MERVDIHDLSRAHLDTLLHLALRGPIEAGAGQEFWEVTQGNPLYVRELVLGALPFGDDSRDRGHRDRRVADHGRPGNACRRSRHGVRPRPRTDRGGSDGWHEDTGPEQRAAHHPG